MAYTIKHIFEEGQRVICTLSETYKPHGIIVHLESSFCFVRFDGSDCNNICRYSELTPINE